MSLTVAPRILRQLRDVFGDCVPKENAAAVLAKSALAPASEQDRKALAAVLGDVAGHKLSELTAAPSSSSVASLHAAQVQARRDLTSGAVLSEQGLAKAWQLVAAMKDVPFSFLEEGCVFRSHVVCKRLEDAGVESEKIFTIPLGADLVMTSDKAKLGYTICWYHEAVVVAVQTKEGVERRVLDPSVADEPLTVDAWLATMRPAKAGVALETFFMPRFAFGLQDRDHPPSAFRDDDLQTAFAWNTDWREAQKYMEESGFYDELPKLLANPP